MFVLFFFLLITILAKSTSNSNVFSDDNGQYWLQDDTQALITGFLNLLLKVLKNRWNFSFVFFVAHLWLFYGSRLCLPWTNHEFRRNVYAKCNFLSHNIMFAFNASKSKRSLQLYPIVDYSYTLCIFSFLRGLF